VAARKLVPATVLVLVTVPVPVPVTVPATGPVPVLVLVTVPVLVPAPEHAKHIRLHILRSTPHLPTLPLTQLLIRQLAPQVTPKVDRQLARQIARQIARLGVPQPAPNLTRSALESNDPRSAARSTYLPIDRGKSIDRCISYVVNEKNEI
jgi:hypothetical protein